MMIALPLFVIIPDGFFKYQVLLKEWVFYFIKFITVYNALDLYWNLQAVFLKDICQTFTGSLMSEDLQFSIW